MAALNFLSFLSLLLALLPTITLADFPYSDKVCDGVECGKGKCVVNTSYDFFNYVCECDDGWKRTIDDDDHPGLLYLPCVIPNCTLNYDCQPAPPPVPEKEFPFNSSFFDPCYWIYCGEGTCTRNHTYTHTCTCNPGYYNLLNISFYPCYSECTLGSDCSKLGIKVANEKASTTGTDGGNQGTSILPGKYHWMMVLLLSVIMVLRN